MRTVIEAVAEFPALSYAVPKTVWTPSDVTVMGDGHEATPEPESLHSKLTVTAVEFQPFASGDGLTLAVIKGGVLSMFMIIVSVCSGSTLSTGGAYPYVKDVAASRQI